MALAHVHVFFMASAFIAEMVSYTTHDNSVLLIDKSCIDVGFIVVFSAITCRRGWP
jgi:hypothetical protein